MEKKGSNIEIIRRSLFVLLYFSFWPLCCLSFFELRLLLVAPLVSSSYSYSKWQTTYDRSESVSKNQ